MRGSLKAVLSRVNRLAKRVQPSPDTANLEELLKILDRGRLENAAGIVHPELSADEARALHARVKAMREQQ